MTNAETTVYIVTCEDGRKRHDSPFKTQDEALTWADMGHFCTNGHKITPTTNREEVARAV